MDAHSSKPLLPDAGKRLSSMRDPPIRPPATPDTEMGLDSQVSLWHKDGSPAAG